MKIILRELFYMMSTPNVERENVRNVYDVIYKHWSNTRYKPWPGVVSFLDSLPENTVLADIGCGNGKYIESSLDGNVNFVLGMDACLPLIHLTSTKHSHQPKKDLFGGDIMNIPLRNESVDAVICIAVLHHLSTEERRIKAIQQLSTILRSGGKILMYTWALDQGKGGKRKFLTQDVMVPWHYRIPGKSYNQEIKGETVLHRFCHVYEEGELEKLVKLAGLNVLKVWKEKGNWGVIASKK